MPWGQIFGRFDQPGTRKIFNKSNLMGVIRPVLLTVIPSALSSQIAVTETRKAQGGSITMNWVRRFWLKINANRRAHCEQTSKFLQLPRELVAIICNEFLVRSSRFCSRCQEAFLTPCIHGIVV